MPTGKTISLCKALALGAVVLGCSSSGNGIGGSGNPTAPSSSLTVSCQVCQPGASVPGCL